MKEQLAIYKKIRKPLPPATMIERPLKGRGYKRPQGNWRTMYYGKEE